MLQLKNIQKNYLSGINEVRALRGVDLTFRENEFVAILGPSGCGKTTLLNIIGGLDRYTSGDLIINGRSTKSYKDRDWDTYRNHSVGFVFQTYNLIPHQSVLSNVELALTLSGVSKTERRKKAKEVLAKVGLADQINKKPNQMSGGQMQRVAIARALINDPDILLADEPTGALDSETSVQVLDLLKEIAKDKLVVMVTHNPELAGKYATRTIKLLDGQITSDSNPCNSAEDKRETSKTNKTSMSFFTALSLSLNNLMTKKGRTILTAIAGSIGIIGIAMILSLSNGVQQYIKRVEQDTLSQFPITINEADVDFGAMMQAMRQEDDRDGRDENRIYSHNIMANVVTAMMQQTSRNNLRKFKEFVDSDESRIAEHVNVIQYQYNINPQFYDSDTSNGPVRVNPNSIMDSIMAGIPGGMNDMSVMSGGGSAYDVFAEMLDNRELLMSQYDVVAGKWPTAYNEVVLVVNEHNEVSDYTLYILGLRDRSEAEGVLLKYMAGEEVTFSDGDYSFDDFLNLTFKLVINSDYYQKNSAGIWIDKSSDEAFLKSLVDNGEEIKVVGIIRPNADALVSSSSGEIFYTKELTEHVIAKINDSQIAKEQLANPEVNAFTGGIYGEMGTACDTTLLSNSVQQALGNLSPEEHQSFIDLCKASYDQNIATIGIVDLDNPNAIYLYPKNFESKEAIQDIITEYNKKAEAEGREDDVISYTDLVGMLMSGVSTIINMISYILIAFVSISLVVSSIMIGIITYISVLERTKEIGILRAVGASKRDISRVFNAETLIEGFAAGVFGIAFTALVNIPINMIINKITGVNNLALLPFNGAVVLIIISVLLTVIAGLIPSRMASRKDPVEALRTE